MTISEIRSMPFEEFKSWQAFYSLEPWGWYDQEYRTAALLAMLVNVNVSKRSDQKQVKDYFRDMLKLVEKAYMEQEYQVSMAEKFKTATPAQRRQMIAQSFGGLAKDR